MQRPRINLFALPSQTAVLFWLIVAALLGAMLIGLTGPHIIPMWPLALVLLLLPFREFIMRPEREMDHQCGLISPPDAEFRGLRESIGILSKQIELKRVPQLLINPKRDEIYAMGSFRHWYIVIRAEKAKKLEELLTNPRKIKSAEAQILHELYHFKNGDYWQLGYLAELFKVSFNLMIWVLVFMGGWGFLLVLVKDAFFQFSVADLLKNIPIEAEEIEELMAAGVMA